MANKKASIFNPNIGMALSFGIQIATFIALGAFLGNLLDERMHIRPWGLILGIIIGFILCIRDALKIMNVKEKG